MYCRLSSSGQFGLTLDSPLGFFNHRLEHLRAVSVELTARGERSDRMQNMGELDTLNTSWKKNPRLVEHFPPVRCDVGHLATWDESQPEGSMRLQFRVGREVADHHAPPQIAKDKHPSFTRCLASEPLRVLMRERPPDEVTEMVVGIVVLRIAFANHGLNSPAPLQGQKNIVRTSFLRDPG
uniref:Uncharacterized protein n=1 Tax=Burkholderia sp. M701 TaxID=326454 RepID=V5YND0_9BURK|nr:hypothetical protein [Burkholderia sp. M701]